MLEKGFELVFHEVKRLSKTGQCLAIDMTNVSLKRAPLISMLRASGYWIQGLIFETPDIAINNRNINLRKSKGGLILNDDRQSQEALLLKLKVNLDHTIQKLLPLSEVNKDQKCGCVWEWDELPRQILQRGIMTEPELVRAGLVDPKHLEDLKSLQESDFFDQLDLVRVQDFSRMSSV